MAQCSPVPVSPMVGPGLRGSVSVCAREAQRAAHGLGDHVEAHVILVGTFPEALDLRVDDPGIDLLDDVVAEAQPLDGAGGEILDHDVGLLQHLREDLAAAFAAEVQRDAALVGVEQHEVVRIHARRVGGRTAPLVAAFRILDLDDIGAQPGERLGARGSGLELGQVEDLHVFQRGLLRHGVNSCQLERFGACVRLTSHGALVLPALPCCALSYLARVATRFRIPRREIEERAAWHIGF